MHVADSLTGLLVPELRAARTLADLGAGVGFPGLALAAALPDARVHLVESVGRKGEWLRRAAEFAGLTNVEVVVARAEEWSATCDVVTARALAPLPVLAEYAAPLLRDGGMLVAWKGTPEARRGRRRRRGLRHSSGCAPSHRWRSSPTRAAAPATCIATARSRRRRRRFPRRAGMAAKRPLGSGVSEGAPRLRQRRRRGCGSGARMVCSDGWLPRPEGTNLVEHARLAENRSRCMLAAVSGESATRSEPTPSPPPLT